MHRKKRSERDEEHEEREERAAEDKASTNAAIERLTKLMGGFVSSVQEQNEKASTAHRQLANTVKIVLQEGSGQAAIAFKDETIVETIIETTPNGSVGEAGQARRSSIRRRRRRKR